MTVAALYVQTNGVYFGLDDVDPWDEKRDARLYDGPWPVVAHPPCEQLAPLAWGRRNDDELGAFKWGSRLYRPEHDRSRKRVDGQHSETPIPFRDVLLDMARSAAMVTV